MENSTNDIGILYGGKVTMGYSSDTRLPGHTRQHSVETLDNQHSIFFYFITNLLTGGRYGLQNVKNKMATLKLSYVLLHIFGFPVAIWAALTAIFPVMTSTIFEDIHIEDLPQPARAIFMILGGAYIFYVVMNARENYRKKKIENDERDYELKKKHLRDKK